MSRMPSVFFFLIFIIAPTAAFAQSPSANLVTLDQPATGSTEDFTDPKLHDGELKQSIALMLQRDEQPTYSRELWHVEWRHEDPIDLYIIRPKGIARPPVILYLYNYLADTAKFEDDSYCKAVSSRGAAAVGFVAALSAERYHDRPWKEWFVSDLPEALGASTHDVQMILNLLETRSDLDMQRVGIFGQGSGATIAALAASVDFRIRAVDLLDPWGDWNNWMMQSPVVSEVERATYESAAFQSQLANLDPLNWLPKLRPDVVRLQQTSFSPDTPRGIQASIASKMPRGAITVQYESINQYRSQAANQSAILEWLSSTLEK